MCFFLVVLLLAAGLALLGLGWLLCWPLLVGLLGLTTGVGALCT